MCGYHELQTPCCNEKTGFRPSPSHKCTHYFTNNRYCRTGSIHSWILACPPLTTNITCENCKQVNDHRRAILQAEIEKEELQRQKERKEQEERRKNERKEQEERRKHEEARQSRMWDKESKRVSEQRKQGKKSAVEALESQLLGMKIDNGEGPSSGGKK
jgi:flagellar biosynthesis GTPase FlhF